MDYRYDDMDRWASSRPADLAEPRGGANPEAAEARALRMRIIFGQFKGKQLAAMKRKLKRLEATAQPRD